MQLLQFKKKNGNVINLKQIGGHKLSKQISYLSYNILSNHLFYINYKVKNLVSRSKSTTISHLMDCISVVCPVNFFREKIFSFHLPVENCCKTYARNKFKDAKFFLPPFLNFLVNF